VFSQFGRIKSATIQKSRALQVSLKFGFVCFNQYGAAQRAIEALDNKEVNGITWVVRPHEKMQDRRRKQQQEYSKTLQNRNQRKISVVNLADEITEDEVRKMFAKSGEIEDIYILRPESQAPVMFNLVNC
jgi:RNA recognition motif-containing protein